MEYNKRQIIELGEHKVEYLWQLNIAMTDIRNGEKELDPSAISKAYEEVKVDLDEVLQEDEGLDEVYSDFKDSVNMTASQLESWSANPCSREASVDPEAVIKRNLRLLTKNKEDWTEGDIKDAKRTISFVSRMRPNKPDEPRDGAFGCPSEWAISLINWAYLPFDSLPDRPDSDELEPVEKIEMQDFEFEENDKVTWNSSGGQAYGVIRDRTSDQCYDASIDGDFKVCGEEGNPAYLIEVYDNDEKALTGTMVAHLENTLESTDFEAEEREQKEMAREEKITQPNYEFQPVPTQVLYDDRERAMERAQNIGLEGVHTHQFGGGQTMYMPGDTHGDWLDFVEGKTGENVRPNRSKPVRMSDEGDSRKARDMFDSYDTTDSEDESNFVRTEPSTIHEISQEEDDE